MSYVFKYTSETDIERMVQFSITDDTRPSSIQVAEIIKRVEKEIDARWLGWPDGGSYGQGYSISNLYIDVPSTYTEEEPSVLGETVEKVYIPYPIVKMNKLERRTSSIEDTPVWEELTEGYYSGWTEGDSDYMVIWTTGPDGQRYGIGWYFYSSKKPKAGRARLRASFTYSYLVPEYILKEYATLKASIQVLELAVASGEPTRLSVYTGGDFQEFVPRELSKVIASWQERLRGIEEKHFPKARNPLSL